MIMKIMHNGMLYVKYGVFLYFQCKVGVMLKKSPQKLQDVSLNDISFDEIVKDYEDFVYIVSHDYGTSISHIEEFTTLLKNSISDMQDDQKLYINYIESSLDRIHLMQDALLELSNINTGHYKKEKVSAQKILEKVISKIDFDDYELNPVISCEPLPVIWGVPSMMENLFYCLIDNACRYSPHNGQQEIFLKGYEQNNEIIFEIKDNGIGIDSEFCEVVFNMFHRLHNQDEYGGGVGAGLTLSKKIIEYHGGNIWLKSQLDVGTSVLFSLPK